MKSQNIKVAVRIRPLLDNEHRDGHTCSKLTIDQPTHSVKYGTILNNFSAYNDRTNSYKNSQFDYVLEQSCSQRKVYDASGIGNLVKAVVEGYHATIFAYGQTGSGKTYTMEGYKYKSNEKGVPVPQIEAGDNEGIVPRAIHQLFELIKKESGMQKRKFTVYCSYLQVYKEKIFDLLNKAQLKRLQNDGPGLKLKWNKFDHFTVENLYTFECKSPDDVLALYHFGIKNKVVASHNMNNASSRSHSVLALTVESIDAKQPDNVLVSKLQLVDLAGSERQSFTGNVANKESIDINKSLFTLRQVISSLTDKKGQSQYIPYRESKLTCLLRQSLGGNSYCLMIACLNPCDAYIEENLNTLQYASKASYISNKPVRNEDPKNKLIEELKMQVRTLTDQLNEANETIQFLSQITGQNPQTIKNNLQNVSLPGMPGGQAGFAEMTNINQIVLGGEKSPSQKTNNGEKRSRLDSASSALTEKRGDTSTKNQSTERIIKDQDNIEKFFREKHDALNSIVNNKAHAANESKDAITERIIHTVNMMKEVLQSNMQLRETNQRQADEIDNLNSLMFQCQNENEDLRERLQTLEEFTGKDSMEEVSRLVKDKKNLENRVRQLEQSSMNMAQFQATRQQFHQQKDKMNQSMVGMQPKATLEDKFNDDYEPVRCQVLSGMAASDQPPPQVPIQFVRNSKSSQKNQKKNQKATIGGKQPRGKSTTVVNQGYDSRNLSNVYSDTASQNERHQDYKIRTVRSLAQAQAYHQSNSFGPGIGQYPPQMIPQSYQGKNMLKTAQFPNNRAVPQQAFVHPQSRFGQAPLNMTAYTQSPFNANYGQDFIDQEDDYAQQMRSKSPMIQTQNMTQSRVTPNQSQGGFQQRQQIQTADPHFGHQMSDLSSASAQGQMPQPHVTKRKQEQLMGQGQIQKKPPKTPSKQGGTMSGQTGIQPMRVTNQSFKSNNAGNLTHDNISEDPFFVETPDNGDEVQDIVYQQSEEDDYLYGAENQEPDAYEIMTQEQFRKMQQMQNMHMQQQMMMQQNNGLQQLDVSLPKIRNN